MDLNFLRGILAKKPAEKPVDKPEKTTLDHTDVLGWLNSRLAKDIENERKEFVSITGNLFQLLRDLEKNVQGIRKKSFEEGDRTYAAVNMIKDTWAKKAVMSFSSYNKEIPKDSIKTEDMGFSDFRNLYHSTVRLMNEITMIPRQKMVLSRYFEPESKRMADIFQSLSTTIDNMRGKINRPGALRNIDQVSCFLGHLSSLKKEIATMETDLKNQGEQISRKESELAGIREKISSIEKMPEWRELDEIEEKIAGSEQRKSAVENDVAEKLGGMKRVFKLFAHDAAGLEKKDRILLDGLSHSPLKAWLTNEPGSIENVLKKMKKDIEAGEFRLSEKDAGKAASLDQLLGSNLLGKARSEHDKIRQSISDLRSRKEGINVKLRKSEEQRLLERTEMELDVLKRKKGELEKGLREREGKLKQKKSEITGFVRKELGMEIKLE